jgi:hypothetical protein
VLKFLAAKILWQVLYINKFCDRGNLFVQALETGRTASLW